MEVLLMLKKCLRCQHLWLWPWHQWPSLAPIAAVSRRKIAGPNIWHVTSSGQQVRTRRDHMRICCWITSQLQSIFQGDCLNSMQNYGILWGDLYHRFLHQKSTQVKDEEPLKTKRSVCGLNSWDRGGSDSRCEKKNLWWTNIAMENGHL